MAASIVTHSYPTVVPIPATVEQVTQLEIVALLSLHNRAHQLEEQIRDAEQSIQTRLESNASVETGEHSAELKESSRRNVAWRYVAERLANRLYGGKGESYCDRVIAGTKPTRTVSLVVQ
jgi:hypothetical protein